MKKIFYLACMLFVLTFVVTIYSCSSDDDESKEINYTADEIAQILKGKWAIKGICIYDLDCYDEIFDDIHYYNKTDTTYKGEIEFYDNMKYKSETSYFNYKDQVLSSFIGNYDSYKVLKKNGETYISFSMLDMKVLYLNKNKFKLLYDGVRGYRDKGHLYLTIESN